MNRKCMKTVPLCCIRWSEMHGFQKEVTISFCIIFALFFMGTVIVNMYRHFTAGTIQHMLLTYSCCFMQSVSLLHLLKSDPHHLTFQVVIEYLVCDYHKSLFYFPFLILCLGIRVNSNLHTMYLSWHSSGSVCIQDYIFFGVAR